MLCQPGVSKLINLIPNHHTGITRFDAHHWFRVDCVIRQNDTWKRSLPTKQRRQRNYWLLSPHKLYAPPYYWNGCRTANWVGKSSPYSKQWREQPHGTFLVWKRNLPAQDPCHTWHMPGKASGTEVAAVAQWWSHSHILGECLNHWTTELPSGRHWTLN